MTKGAANDPKPPFEFRQVSVRSATLLHIKDQFRRHKEIVINWEAIGALGELIGALAVVLSLLYLATQIRQNTSIVKAHSTTDAATSIRDWFSDLATDPELGRIFMVGVEGIEKLEEPERLRFAIIMFNFFKAMEDIHYRATHGLMDAELWTGWDYQIRQYTSAPGAQSYWKERKNGYSLSFQIYIDAAEPDPKFKRGKVFAESLVGGQ